MTDTVRPRQVLKNCSSVVRRAGTQERFVTLGTEGLATGKTLSSDSPMSSGKEASVS